MTDTFHRLQLLSALLLMLLLPLTAAAQITIGGNVYGGGNKGNTGGSSTVTVHAGDLNKVFGGARQANVGGSAFVNIDGEHAKDYILINYVYGGNDISGTIGTSDELPQQTVTTTNKETGEKTTKQEDILTATAENNIDNTWNAFVRVTSSNKKETEPEGTDEEKAAAKRKAQIGKVYIGQLFGGGNGAYDYADGDYKDMGKPDLGKTYLELLGGSIVYAYGGGNNATVTEKTVIHLDNKSEVVHSITDDDGNGLLTEDRSRDAMGINMAYSFPTSAQYQIGNFYGGNNSAEMAIRPLWNLKAGKIRNLYSGGNRGRMTSPEGLLLDINPTDDDALVVENVYGGCRMADVFPSNNGTDYVPTTNLAGYHFPDEFSARLIVRGGTITNVYGGNDIRGKVYGGNAVGIYTSILGDVYGGGNGSYPYTDNPALKSDQTYGDFYYDPDKVLDDNNLSATSDDLKSVEALNAIRPNAEQVSIRVYGGKDHSDPTVIRGAIYLGGNSATLSPSGSGTPTVELKIGSHVIADKVFLGNNGENMVATNVEDRDNYKYEGVLRTMQRTDLTSDGSHFSSIDLTIPSTFATYMDGAAMQIMPSVVFDNTEKGDPDDYEEYSTYFGSFYCGGNVGSMTKDGLENITFDHKVVIFDKLVGGCNNAIVKEQTDEDDATKKFNALYEGGLTGNADATTGNRLQLNLSGLLVEPRRWKEDVDVSANYPDNYLEWNTVTFDETSGKYKPDDPVDPDAPLDPDDEHATSVTSSDADLARRLEGGNIYGGCYTSGIVNGNVVININGTIINRDKLFDEVVEDDQGEAVYYNNETYNIKARHTGVILGQQGMDVLGKALNVFGGGYGQDTEIWGSTTINLSKGYTFQIFGGSEKGVIGKPGDGEGDDYPFNGKTFRYNPKYSCTVNVNGQNVGVSKKADSSEDMADCEFIYGGGFLGPIVGNTTVNLGKGRVFNTFAGSCNADILGHTETYIGRQVKTDGTIDPDGGFPWVRDIVYGGNDLGGRILGSKDFADRVTDIAKTKMYDGSYGNNGANGTNGANETNGANGANGSNGANESYETHKTHETHESHEPHKPTTAAAYVEYLQGRADAIFGGCYGTYDYTDSEYSDYFDTDGQPKEGYCKPYMANAFVNFRPTYTNVNNMVNKVYGAGQGYTGDRDGDKMQDRSYVLVDIPQDMAYYKSMEVFGAGSWDGLGMRYIYNKVGNKDASFNESAAVIDLVRGQIGAAYGGSYQEGVTRHTLVRVPEGSTIKLGSIFGGAYGDDILKPCDVYDANVDYRSSAAWLINDSTLVDAGGKVLGKGAIYGGNNNNRRTIYSKVNIHAPVRMDHLKYGETTGYVYGAGYGLDTWAEYTEVNLENGAEVYEVYGGAEEGHVLNAESVQTYMTDFASEQGLDADSPKWKAAWRLGGGYDPETPENPGNPENPETPAYKDNAITNLSNAALVRRAEMDDRKNATYTYNTNVIIKQGATVNNYAYGGGLGRDGIARSGDVNGTTYVALLGGTVKKDIYSAGTIGAVLDDFGAENFTASANAYIEGGTCRNVYGGGWKGDVGRHTGTEADPNSTEGDILGEAHVVIGIRKDQATLPDGYGYLKGVPAIQRNAYSGGEGGAVFGSAHLTLNNGYIGYVHLNAGEAQDAQGNTVTDESATAERYEEKINDETYYVDKVWQGEGRLRDCGNMFGGGYDVRSSVDDTKVTIWGGEVRNSVHGGAEIATVGRGAVDQSGEANSVRELKGIYKPGSTHVEIYNGHIGRNVFGGGKGYNIWGYGQQGTLYTDGYVFGSTEVEIHGGEIGTAEGVADGYGNVFGGGDIGYVYSGSYMTGSHSEETGSPAHYYYKDAEGNLTEDCRVVISPYLQVMKATTINDKDYEPYEYVPTEDLNTLPMKNTETNKWDKEWLDLFTETTTGVERGITIHNAVFGGGNVSSNSDKSYANATSIYGNTTATLYDVYHRDFITIGTEHTGGLYGGGNLSLVNGYRELNITNYGTDYYGLEEQITLDEYRSLSNRERAYFQLQYICKADILIGDEPYKAEQKISEEDYLKLVEQYGDTARNAFTPFGFCSIYAGRLLNTIQRADFCGVYGSRMVLQGAKDRVADVGEDIEYTINRVGELSLNQQHSVAGDNVTHGNYFGIYSLVNYMGNLTSDVKFGDTRRYKDGKEEKDDPDGKTYYSYKADRYQGGNPKSDRNKGVSANQVALASGVFLELTTEKSTAEKKDYGYITGVVELDLINVKRDQVGGGFVYAKNEHRVPMYFPNKKNVLLSEYNKALKIGDTEARDEARTNKRYFYTADGLPTGAEVDDAYVISRDDEHVYQTMEWETSGNFIHPSKTIVDDCYPTNNAYIIGSDNYSEAHYWYVKGEVYVYDQKVSAYTGSANAYSKAVHLPLTITAASHGRLQLLNVKPNLYAYWADAEHTKKIGDLDENGKEIEKVWVNNESDGYALNEVVTWWDWHLMSYKDRQCFVTQTYVNCEACTVDGVEYATGQYVMDDTAFNTFKSKSHTMLNDEGETVSMTVADVANLFRASNNIGHDTGYVLTFDMDTPKAWDDYYTKNSDSSDKLTKERYDALTSGASDYVEGPTFTPVATGTYGQRNITEGDIITKTVYDHTDREHSTATVEPAYVATTNVTYTVSVTDADGETTTITKTTNAGTAIPESEYNKLDTDAKNAFAPAYFCTQTIKLAESSYLGYGELKTEAEITTLETDYASLAEDIKGAMTPAYICSKEGTFGGQKFTAGTNYSALATWCSLPESDRFDELGNKQFTFNYDAFDLLSSNDFLKINLGATEVPVDQANVASDTPNTKTSFHEPYSKVVGVEYVAVYQAPKEGDKYTYAAGTLEDGTAYDGGTLSNGDAISNAVFEAAVRNDKVHYTRVSVAGHGEDIYLATENFVYDGTPYAKGQVVDETLYKKAADKVEKVHIENSGSSADTRFYCYEDYTKADGTTVAKGACIDETDYAALQNDQQYFVIQGKEPNETTTLYVSSESDIKDVTSKRVYTVVYQYTYYDEDDDGSIKLSNELHVVNIHIELESGAPSVGMVTPPGTVLPGDAVGLKAPEVKPGLYEVLTNGWELYLNENDAIHHRNGIPFTNNQTPVYWYQHQKNYIAFYSKTYLGKTYSKNYVPLSVANYHDLKEVLTDKDHLHIDYDPTQLYRDCKIYINDYSPATGGSVGGGSATDPSTGGSATATPTGLDLLHSLVDLTYGDETAKDAYGSLATPDNIRGAANLDIILRTDIAHDGSPWTPIANADGQCFSGTLHGDGHTLSGLDNSLFGHLCGEVYNLGVTGSFTSAGIAETGEGYMENCWIQTSGTPETGDGHYAVFGNPTREAGDSRGPVQVVNCYYPESNAYSVPASTTHGQATQMPDKAFYNGTVAYNLNGFYLNKRYYDHAATSDGSATNRSAYGYLLSAADGTLPATESTALYPNTYALYRPSGTVDTPYLGYVEHRFYDGDFIFAGGNIPEGNNIRMRTESTTDADGHTTVSHYYVPIWPDDYLFFGQTLTYGYSDTRKHQETPAIIRHTGERLSTGNASNRVYRAPAYFRSKRMDVAHFNPAAIFAKAKSDDANITAYQDMTAIDFTGGNGDLAAGYHQGRLYWTNGSDDWRNGSYESYESYKSHESHEPHEPNGHEAFFPPLLDDGGLTSFQNVDLTRNLLVYTSERGTATAAQKTAAVVGDYLTDETYRETYRETHPGYRTVDQWDRYADNIRGHWVSQTDAGDYVAPNDHMLVDRWDFNAPIAYQMAAGKRMWYQRTPDNFVDLEKGWEAISLPFKAEVVTTQQKGELTHFYNTGSASGSFASDLGKVGHEYWLRQFTGISYEASAGSGNSEGSETPATVTASFEYPSANSDDGKKDYANTFLWDYYYSHNSYDDQNRDDYQEKDGRRTYYKEGREYPDYPLMAAATPYIIGFPGATFYEFDLSGNFAPSTTSAPRPEQLDKQTVTFASKTGAAIGVSDDEMAGTTHGDYTFRPNYLSTEIAANAGYVLNAAGNGFAKTTAATTVAPFRPYFTQSTAPAGARTRSADQIVFSQSQESLLSPWLQDSPDADSPGTLSVRGGKRRVIVESSLRAAADVRIVNTAGITVAAFTVEPGQTVETRVPVSGVYIVQTTDGRHNMKLAVR